MNGNISIFAQKKTHQPDTTLFRFPVFEEKAKTKDLFPDNLQMQRLKRKKLVPYQTTTPYRILQPDFPTNNEEYVDFRIRQSLYAYFSGDETAPPPPKETLIFAIPIGNEISADKRNFFDKVFGKGGIQFHAQGSLEATAGIKRNVINNPTLPENSKKRTLFDFDKKIRLKANAKVGEKIDFGMNYDTDATFDFDAKRIKLSYQGDENEFVKNVEAGNVSITTGNSLINGGAALFGIKSDLQFGKLRVSTILSQQEGEARTINSQGGIQTTPFEFRADQYDENQHFFLGYYFRNQYDEAMSKLPFVQSSVSITRMEVWITNKRGNYEQARNIAAFADLGEYADIHNALWTPQGSESVPYNNANNLYQQLTSTYAAARDFNRISQILPALVALGNDYEKIESARLLNPSEYVFQPQLGYISLRIPLQPDEALAVAFEFTFNGKAYQVGEFSTDMGKEATNGTLFAKLLKPVSLTPKSHTWKLAMRNIYSLGRSAYNIQSDRFKFDIAYQSDNKGTYLNYLPETPLKDEQLLRVMRLDRLNTKNAPYPDGNFDFLDGYTVSSQTGRIIFPVVEPFGSHLRKKIANDAIANQFVYQQLYDSTLTVARQFPEKNKFRMQGEFRGTSASEINLNAANVARGSVRVTAGGVTLAEGSDYTVDYAAGSVNIINQAILDAGTPVSVSLENQSQPGMQRKTMMGINLTYDFSPNFIAGGTLMHYYEKPLGMKTAFGEESVKNTLWGLNASFRRQSQWITDMLDKLPFVEATAPSQFIANIEFAQLLPGHYRNKYTGAYSYLDDFEAAASGIDLRSPHAWSLASTPFNNTSSGLFPEAALSNNIAYGKNRAHLAWFYIDNIFTQPNSKHTPAHIRNDKEQLSNHFVREVYEREIYPNKEAVYMRPPTLPILNLSYYPNERGAYNLDTDIDNNGFLLNPCKRWGGIMRAIETRDFEAANIEHIEFWLMDPFVNDTEQPARGGDLYFNLGEISEDILKDGKKFFENGLPVDGDESAIGYSVWGKYPKRQSTGYAFDNSRGAESRRIQDVGLNGLSSEEEKNYEPYAHYLNELKPRLSGETLLRMQNDAHSPLNDLAGDTFRHFRGEKQDREKMSILNRYKYFNGTEGNSLASEHEGLYGTASKTTPDAEDVDNDNTLNENESYYQYKVQLRPANMVVGTNFIVDKREVSVTLQNGKNDNITWYKFRIPIREYQTRVGNIQGFNNMRFMRMFLTDFEKPTFLRFATLELVRSEWRVYGQDIHSGGAISGLGTMRVSTVNIEENTDRTPVNYVLPPDVSRIPDPTQPQLRQQNEQALSLKVENLDPTDVRAVYKSAMYDLRRYKRLQLFVHAEALSENPDNLQDNDMTIFLRLGSDYRNNYYEYEIPLSVTPHGKYSQNNSEAVWKPSNMFDISLEKLTTLKLNRNTEKTAGSGTTYFTPYSVQDTDKPANKLTVMGNPSLAEVKVLMIGVRNRAKSNKSAEIWINELRMSEFDEKGGWAVNGNMNLALSDIGIVSLSGRKETVGFGALNQGLHERRNDDFSSINLSFNLELGRFLPKQAKISAPFYYSFSTQKTAMYYDPMDKDILLSESLSRARNRQEKDSRSNLSLTKFESKSININNMRVNIRSKHPMPYDPASFSFGYAYNENKYRNPETEYSTTLDYRLQMNYSYVPIAKPWEPFRNVKSQSEWLKFIKSMALNYVPQSIQISSNIVRNYQETQLRDLNNNMAGTTHTQSQFLSFSQNFFWNRSFSFIWDLTRNLKTSFRSGTIAEIEEPYLQVNRKVNRSDYEVWKDSVVQSIRTLGKPLNYEQTADVTYTLPFSQIPKLNWINASIAYNARYRWERGAFIENENIGNYLQNDMSLTFNGRLNMVAFYNKIPFLRKTNQRFNRAYAAKKHNEEESISVAHYFARGFMTIRNINVNVSYKNRSDIPGFIPMIGDIFGQKNGSGELVPGLAFAFGLDGGEHFIRKSLENNRLVINEKNIARALYNQTQNMRMDATLEPFSGLKIDVNVLYENNRRTEFQYMFKDVPKIYGGSFAMTTFMLPSAFENANAKNNYRSTTFEQFRKNQDIIVSRLREAYANTRYPNSGFLKNSAWQDSPFQPTNGDVNPNSSDVLIPAFLAAYTGKSAKNIARTPFPSLWAILPNWDISYNVLSGFPDLRKNFKSVLFTHKYISQYRVGAYSSYLNWVAATDNGDLGFIRDVISGAPIPSSPYDISAVSLIESFNPLFEVQSVLDNNISLNFRINKTRSLNLYVSSRQVVETSDNDYVTGIGYRVPDFNKILGLKSRAGNQKPDETDVQDFTFQASRQSFNNDLNIRLDVSYKTTRALIRKIEDAFTQATGGLRTTSFMFSADYALSRAITLRAFFDKVINVPLVSLSSYSTSVTSAGVSVRLNLNQ